MPEIDVICFGGEDWWYHNRGHFDMQIMRRFARNGKVLYVNSIVMQKLKIGRGKGFVQKVVRKARSIFKGLRKSDAGFWVYSPFSLPVHHIRGLRKINEVLLRLQLGRIRRMLQINNPIVWVACPAACEVAIKMKRDKLVYQRTDRYEEFPNVDADIIIRYDRRLKAVAELTVFANEFLYQKESDQCRKAVFIDHGVDYEMFATAENDKEIPTDIKDVQRPIVGFFGGIDNHTCDIELLNDIAEQLPEMNFVLVGKHSVDCEALFSKKNVRMLGQKPYKQIPHYGKCFDVAIMPWRQNRWIKACNPIKLKEYLALGKPVVSTPFQELQKYTDVVYEAKTREEFVNLIKKAVSEKDDELVTKRKKKVAGASWDSKAELVLRELLPDERFAPAIICNG